MDTNHWSKYPLAWHAVLCALWASLGPSGTKTFECWTIRLGVALTIMDTSWHPEPWPWCNYFFYFHNPQCIIGQRTCNFRYVYKEAKDYRPYWVNILDTFDAKFTGSWRKPSPSAWGKCATAPWWRHQMETLCALLALCVGNSPVHDEFPLQRPVTGSFDVFLSAPWINDWANNREACDLRRHRAHYDVIVMTVK